MTTHITQRAQQVLDLINMDPTMTLQAIANELGITRERVRQITNKLNNAGVIPSRKDMRKAAIDQGKSERHQRVVYRKKIWRRMIFVSNRTRLRRMGQIDHRGLVQGYHMPGEEAICQFEGCNQSVRARGFCARHYAILRFTGALWVRRNSRYTCKEDGCDMPVYARDMCHNHYNAHKRKHPNKSHLPAHNTSGYRGVTANRYGTWTANIRNPKGQQEHLGTFDTKEMAARAYDTAARRLFGERAKLNFPNEYIEVIGRKRTQGERNPSGYKGVSWQNSRKRWMVKFIRGDKTIFVGRFTDLELAARAYDTAVRHAGIDSPLNFPDDTTEVFPQGTKPNGTRSNKTSQYRGVSWDKSRNRWTARLEVNGKVIGFGRFSDEEIAARAYDAGLRQLFGDDDPRQNFPGERVEVVRLQKQGASSRFRGVSWHCHKKKWEASVSANGKRYRLGYFSDEVEAARAYDSAARQYLGDAAQLNFPEE